METKKNKNAKIENPQDHLTLTEPPRAWCSQRPSRCVALGNSRVLRRLRTTKRRFSVEKRAETSQNLFWEQKQALLLRSGSPTAKQGSPCSYITIPKQEVLPALEASISAIFIRCAVMSLFLFFFIGGCLLVCFEDIFLDEVK